MKEAPENIVIVGAGIAGLATALGLHRLGLRSVVLESSDQLRASGFALATWSNAWRALDVLGAADSLRRRHIQLQEVVVVSAASGEITSQMTFKSQAKSVEEPEFRCLRRNLLLDALASDLPEGTIRFGSKVVLIEEQGRLKLLHLADGSTLKTKVLIGCDGVNSVVARWLGFGSPSFAGRSASRGIAEFAGGHGFKPYFLQCMGDGFRSGFLPCDDKHVYWFFTYSSSSPKEEEELENDMAKMKRYILSKLQKAPKGVVEAVERTEPGAIISSPLRLRWPFELLWGGVRRGNVCLAGDALHAMTPDLGQGGCSALEDGVTLARCLGEVFQGRPPGGGAEEEHERIEEGLEKYARERKWRSFELVCTAYVLGRIQQSDGAVMNFLRDRLLAPIMARKLLKMAEFDCGDLSPSTK